jgi:peptide-methionine (S)-S-oxide reductase
VLILALLLLPGNVLALTPPRTQNGVATFAGGCFWCMEGPFEKLPGVLAVTSGYTGGQKAAPSYEQVSSGTTGHAEAVQVVYDRRRISFERLLEVFWRNIDPLSANGQFCDRGSQYRSAVYFHDAEQRAAAEASRAKIQQRFLEKVVTEVTAASAFYPAEEYHQDYYKKNPVRYQTYRSGCGRDRRLRELWGEPGAH